LVSLRKICGDVNSKEFVIQKFIESIEFCDEDDTQVIELADALVEITNDDQRLAIAVEQLIKLIKSSDNESTVIEASEILYKITKHDEMIVVASNKLIELIEKNIDDKNTQRELAESLGKIAPNKQFKEIAVNKLINLIEDYDYEYELSRSVTSLLKIATDGDIKNQTNQVITHLVESCDNAVDILIEAVEELQETSTNSDWKEIVVIALFKLVDIHLYDGYQKERLLEILGEVTTDADIRIKDITTGYSYYIYKGNLRANDSTKGIFGTSIINSSKLNDNNNFRIQQNELYDYEKESDPNKLRTVC
jgi:glutamate racemase